MSQIEVDLECGFGAIEVELVIGREGWFCLEEGVGFFMASCI